MTKILYGIGLGCLLLGCASYPKPVESLASSEASIRTAQEEDAQQYPNAALHVQLAKEELGKAQTLIKERENEKADWILMRSHADAELAIALIRQAKAEDAAKQEQDRPKTMKGVLIAPSSTTAPQKPPEAETPEGAKP